MCDNDDERRAGMSWSAPQVAAFGGAVDLTASGTSGQTAVTREPNAYSGTCGPGTLVIVRLKSRVANRVRARNVWSTGGACAARSTIPREPIA